MWRKCKRCNYDINNSYLFKQKEMKEIICPNCGRTLVVTDISKVVTFSYFIMFLIIFIILPLNKVLILVLECIWVILSYRVLPVLFFDYKEKT